MSRREDFLTAPAGCVLPTGGRSIGGQWCEFRQPIEPNFKTESTRLIITVAVGKSLEMLRASRPAMEAYAVRTGADFIALTNRTQTWALAEKFRVAHFARRYNRTLYVDADVFIRNYAPDIFAHVPWRSIAMHDDLGDREPERWLLDETRALGESQGCAIPPKCWNSGVVLCDGPDADVWAAPPKPFLVTHCSEQHWVQRNAVEKGRIFSLATPWNWQWWQHKTFEHMDEAFFVHLSGMYPHPELQLPLMRALALR